MKKYINQQDMKDTNVHNVLRLIREKGRLTRRNIEASTNLSWGAVSKVTSILLEKGYIRETKTDTSSGPGRTPIYLEINPDEYFTVGIDINKSGLFAVIINMKNEVRYFVLRKIEIFKKAELLDEIVSVIEEILEFAAEHITLGIGIAMQGLVDSEKGISVEFQVCSDWENVALKKLLEERFNIPVFVEHDPECILYAHSELQSKDDCLLVRVDNGIGMAVMLNGKIFKRFGAFELGHIKVVRDGEENQLDYYASTDGFEARYGKKIEEIAEEAKTGKTEAVKLFSDMSELFSRSIINVAGLFNIRDVMLCGEMFEYGELFYDDFVKKAGENLRFYHADVKNAATGAAMIAMNFAELSF